MASAVLNKIETAHIMYRDGKYKEALWFYTGALSVAKTKQQRIALHSNRAACLLKLQDLKKAAEECTSVLELDRSHTGALMLRAQTLVTLRDFHSALFDVNRLMELNPASEVYRNLETRLRTHLSLAPIPESDAEMEEEEEEDDTTIFRHEEEGQGDKDVDMVVGGTTEKNELMSEADNDVITPKTPEIEDSSAQGLDKKFERRKTIAAEILAQAQYKTEPRKAVVSQVIAQSQQKVDPGKTATATVEEIVLAQKMNELPEQHSKGWQAIPKPKGHSTLDYARWDRVKDDSSEDDDECEPQYRFRVKTVGVRLV